MKRILVVDDEPSIRSLMKSILESFGYEVEVAEKPSVAIALVEKTKFNLVITDFSMPETNGAKMAVKLQDINPNMKFILMSANPPTESELKDFCEQREIFFKVMLKPFDISDLEKLIKEALEEE